MGFESSDLLDDLLYHCASLDFQLTTSFRDLCDKLLVHTLFPTAFRCLSNGVEAKSGSSRFLAGYSLGLLHDLLRLSIHDLHGNGADDPVGRAKHCDYHRNEAVLYQRRSEPLQSNGLGCFHTGFGSMFVRNVQHFGRRLHLLDEYEILAFDSELYGALVRSNQHISH